MNSCSAKNLKELGHLHEILLKRKASCSSLFDQHLRTAHRSSGNSFKAHAFSLLLLISRKLWKLQGVGYHAGFSLGNRRSLTLGTDRMELWTSRDI